ncbi:MAG: Rieske 2Fe-2S domain-containing protein [Dehalococcoidia bacterium]
MLSSHDNETLTRTNAGTQMGDLLRRFWLPVLLAQELPAPDCDPVRVHVCGEEYVAFRDTFGRVGLLDARCPHRLAELFWGRNEEAGLRCVYHGWKFDIDGTCLDLPSEPAESNFKDKVRIGAYPAQEYGGLIWGYFGPPDQLPELPKLEFGHVPPEHLCVSKKLQECNWAQAVEGAIDTAHFSFLHMPKEVDDSSPQIVRWMKNDGSPRFTVIPHDAGFVIGGARTTESDDLYWRITQFLVPNHSLAPGSMAQDNMNGQTWVPIDDHHCWIYCYTWNPWRPITDTERALMGGGFGIHSEVDANWRPLRNRDNDYLIDRQAQRTTSFTGVRGISEQDAYIQDSQGAIVDRTKEHLGTTDIAIIEWRKLMLKLARDLREGDEPPYVRRPEAYWLRSGGAVAPSSVPFADLVAARTKVD